MIVDPDFPDHWKTRMLVDLLAGDEAAPMYLIRLWAHCQLRRTWCFQNLPPAALKALCRFPRPAEELETALVSCGWLKRESDTLAVCGWEEFNRSLIANWTNGPKGGRPRKKSAAGSPPETHGFSMGIPRETRGEPIREDRIREDEIPPLIPPEGGKIEKERCLPEGWKKLTRDERKRVRVNHNSPMMLRLGKFFNRKESTLWTVAEALALWESKPGDEEVALLERYYALGLDKDGDFRRRDLPTLLNNWLTEVDRAQSHFATSSAA